MKIEKKYSNYIQGKRVAFVGPCPNIKGMGGGKQIDNFDIVVKTNGSVFLDDKEYFRDYGKRIDVLYTNVQFAREMNPLPCKFFKNIGIEWLCMKSPSKQQLIDYGKHLKTRSAKESLKHVQEIIKSATMGNAILYDILKYNPKCLYITGIDFFASKKKVFEHDNYQEYLDRYLPGNIRAQGNEINKGKKEDGHNFIGNAKYVYSLFEQYKKILYTDDFIYQLLLEIVHGKRSQM